MAEERLLVMPKLGLTMTDGVVAKWEMAAGDRFAAGDVLVIIETDKTTHEVEAPAPGVLGPIKVAEAQTVEVGTVLADWTLDAGSESNGSPSAAEVSAPRATSLSRAAALDAAVSSGPPRPAAIGAAHAVGAAGARILATPYARRVADEHGMDLRSVRGSGPRGRIHARDLAIVEFPAPARAPAPRAGDSGVYCSITADIDVTRLVDVWRSFTRGDDAPDIALAHVFIGGVVRALRAFSYAQEQHQGDARGTRGHPGIRVTTHADRGVVSRVFDALDGVSFMQMKGKLDAAGEGGHEVPKEPAFITISNVGDFGIRYMTSRPPSGEAMSITFGAVQEAFGPDTSGVPVLRREVGMVLTVDEALIDQRAALSFLDELRTVLGRPLSILLG